MDINTRKYIRDLMLKRKQGYEEFYKEPYIKSKFIEGLTAGHFGTEERREPASKTEKLLGTAAEFAGMALPLTGSMKVGGLATKALGLGTGLMSRILAEAAGGAVYGAIEPAENERERVVNSLENALIFAGLGIAGEGLKRVIKRLRFGKGALRDDELGEIADAIGDDKEVRKKVVDMMPANTRERMKRAVPTVDSSMPPLKGPDMLPSGVSGPPLPPERGLPPGPAEQEMIIRELEQLPGGGVRVQTGIPKRLPASDVSTLAGDKGVIIKGKGSFSLKKIEPGDVYFSKKEPGKKFVVNNVFNSNGRRMVALKGEGPGKVLVPVKDFRRDYVFYGKDIEEVTKQGIEKPSESSLRKEIENIKTVSSKIVEKEPVKTSFPDIFEQAKEVKKRIKAKEAIENEVKSETVFYEDLKQGDTFTIKGEKFEVKEKTPSKLKVKDGVTYELEPGFSPLDIDAGSLKKKKVVKKVGKKEINKGAVDIDDDFRSVIEVERENLNKGKVVKGGLIKDSEGKVVGRYGSSSENPEWYKRRLSGKYNKKDVLRVMEKVVKGEALTPRQKKIWSEIKGAIKEEVYRQKKAAEVSPLYRSTEAAAGAPQKAASAAAKKEPWEMTKEEFIGKKPKVNKLARNWNEERFLSSDPMPIDIKPIHQGRLRNIYGIDKPIKYEYGIAKDKSGNRYLLVVRNVDKKGKPLSGSYGKWGPIGEYDGDNIGILETYRGDGAGTAFVNALTKKGVLKPSIGYSPEGLKLWEKAHREAVEKAIKEGKNVPKEVLKDYPEFEKFIKEAKDKKKLYSISPAGAAAGFERDEDGNWHYDPVKGVIGAMAGIALGMAAGKMAGWREISKIKSLGEKAGGDAL